MARKDADKENDMKKEPDDRQTGLSVKNLPAIPEGLQRLLLIAAVDEEFERLLLNDREAAVESASIDLSVDEFAILKSLPQKQLAGMIAKIRPENQDRREFLRSIAKSAVAGITFAAFGPAVESCSSVDEAQLSYVFKMDGSAGVRPENNSGEIIGRVVDAESNMPIPCNVNFGSDELVSVGCDTENGSFQQTVPAGTYHIRITSEGYRSGEFIVPVHRISKTIGTFTLKRKISDGD